MRNLMLAGILACAASGAMSATVGYELRIGGKSDTPNVKLVNTSSSADIMSFTITIGDKSRNFDFAKVNRKGAKELDGGKQRLARGDRHENGKRTGALKIKYKGFDAGESAKFRADIDIDSKNSKENFRDVLFGMAGGKKSLVIVKFSDGTTLRQRLGTNVANAKWYSFSKSKGFPLFAEGEKPGLDPNGQQLIVEGNTLGQPGGNTPTQVVRPENDMVPVPLPAGGLLVLSGLGLLGAMRRRRRT